MKNILFDLDGTLTDPKVGITKSVAHALKLYGIEVNDLDTLCKFIGPPLIQSFCEYYGFDTKKATDAVDVYREYFSVNGLFENDVYPGIEDMLKALKADGKRLFVATSKPERFAKEILRHFGLDKYFECIRGIEMNEEHVTKAAVISRVMKAYSLAAHDTIMVGDRSFDIEGAKENGLDCIAVLYGYGNREEFEKSGAYQIVETVEQLQNHLRSQKWTL